MEDCDPVLGKIVQKLGGWLQVESMATWVEGEDNFGLRFSRFDSVAMVADKTGKIVAIYPGKDIKDLSWIMDKHAKLLSSGDRGPTVFKAPCGY